MPVKVSESELLTALTEVFRTHGYEGATLSLISQATGLKKSSLYHRFPKGKEQMASAVLDSAIEHLENYVLEPLSGDGSVRSRVKRTAQRISEFYGGGEKACFLDTMSIGLNQPESISEKLRHAYDGLIEAFAEIAQEAGHPRKIAKQRAIDTVVQLEGAIVISRIYGRTSVFRSVLARFPDLICNF